MAGRVEGKVAFITGAARGQGRSHAIRLAEEGADIIAIDICGQVDSRAVRDGDRGRPGRDGQGGRGAGPADRRRPRPTSATRRVKAALDDGVAQLGRLDIVAANAGIFSFGAGRRADGADWQDMIDINLTGVWHTAKAAIPHLMAAAAAARSC